MCGRGGASQTLLLLYLFAALDHYRSVNLSEGSSVVLLEELILITESPRSWFNLKIA